MRGKSSVRAMLKLALFSLLMVGAGYSNAVIERIIVGGSEEALPIAVVPFKNLSNKALPHDVSKVIRDDLEYSGDFRLLGQSDMLSLPSRVDQIYYRDWRLLGRDYVLVGEIDYDAGADEFKVYYDLVNVHQQSIVDSGTIISSANGLRKLAHRISDKVYQAITGVEGAFSTRIAYITSKQLPGNKAEYRLQIADADGFNEQTLFKSHEPMLSPAWSNDAQHIAYVSFHTGRPAIYIQHIRSALQRQVTDFKGINSAPMWSPDDSKLVMTLSKDGNAEIYSFDLAEDKLTRLTNHYGIDTEASWSPDGRSIVFTSNRGGGRPQVYQMSLNDRMPKRLTFEGRYNARPRFSRDGENIFYVHQVDGRFHIASLDMKTRENQILTSTELDESPSVSPNGRMIIYATKRGGKGVLAVVSVDGGAKYFLPSSYGDIQEPAWSPFLN